MSLRIALRTLRVAEKKLKIFNTTTTASPFVAKDCSGDYLLHRSRLFSLSSEREVSCSQSRSITREEFVKLLNYNSVISTLVLVVDVVVISTS